MNEVEVLHTNVFTRTWKAINEMAYHPDGSPVLDPITGKHLRRYKYIIHKGSSRSSKTRSLIQLYYRLWMDKVGWRLSVWRDTKKDCRDTVGYDMLQVFQTLPGYLPSYYNKTEASFSSPTDSRIEVNGTDDETKVHGYNGHVIWLNEPYKMSRATFDQLDQRTEEIVVIDWNPLLAHWLEDLEKDPRALVIHSTFKDNPFCPHEQRIKILSYQPVKLCDVVISGLLSEQDAKAYNLTENPLKLTERQMKELARCKENERKGSASAFNWSVYGLGIRAERPNRIFHWTEISDDDYNKIDAKRYYAVDWGVVDPWGILEGKYYDGALYLHEKNYVSENQIMESLSTLDREALRNKTEGLVGWWFERLGIPKTSYIPCDDNRPLKVVALREAGWDYAMTAIKGPGSVIDGISLLSKLRIFYTSSSLNLKNEQENYSRLVDRFGSVLEEPEDLNNHLIDPARYLAQFLWREGIIKVV